MAGFLSSSTLINRFRKRSFIHGPVFLKNLDVACLDHLVSLNASKRELQLKTSRFFFFFFKRTFLRNYIFFLHIMLLESLVVPDYLQNMFNVPRSIEGHDKRKGIEEFPVVTILVFPNVNHGQTIGWSTRSSRFCPNFCKFYSFASPLCSKRSRALDNVLESMSLCKVQLHNPPLI